MNIAPGQCRAHPRDDVLKEKIECPQGDHPRHRGGDIYPPNNPSVRPRSRQRRPGDALTARRSASRWGFSGKLGDHPRVPAECVQDGLASASADSPFEPKLRMHYRVRPARSGRRASRSTPCGQPDRHLHRRASSATAPKPLRAQPHRPGDLHGKRRTRHLIPAVVRRVWTPTMHAAAAWSSCHPFTHLEKELERNGARDHGDPEGIALQVDGRTIRTGTGQPHRSVLRCL